MKYLTEGVKMGYQRAVDYKRQQTESNMKIKLLEYMAQKMKNNVLLSKDKEEKNKQVDKSEDKNKEAKIKTSEKKAIMKKDDGDMETTKTFMKNGKKSYVTIGAKEHAERKALELKKAEEKFNEAQERLKLVELEEKKLQEKKFLNYLATGVKFGQKLYMKIQEDAEKERIEIENEIIEEDQAKKRIIAEMTKNVVPKDTQEEKEDKEDKEEKDIEETKNSFLTLFAKSLRINHKKHTKNQVDEEEKKRLEEKELKRLEEEKNKEKRKNTFLNMFAKSLQINHKRHTKRELEEKEERKRIEEEERKRVEKEQKRLEEKKEKEKQANSFLALFAKSLKLNHKKHTTTKNELSQINEENRDEKDKIEEKDKNKDKKRLLNLFAKGLKVGHRKQLKLEQGKKLEKEKLALELEKIEKEEKELEKKNNLLAILAAGIQHRHKTEKELESEVKKKMLLMENEAKLNKLKEEEEKKEEERKATLEQITTNLKSEQNEEEIDQAKKIEDHLEKMKAEEDEAEIKRLKSIIAAGLRIGHKKHKEMSEEKLLYEEKLEKVMINIKQIETEKKKLKSHQDLLRLLATGVKGTKNKSSEGENEVKKDKKNMGVLESKLLSIEAQEMKLNEQQELEQQNKDLLKFLLQGIMIGKKRADLTEGSKEKTVTQSEDSNDDVGELKPINKIGNFLKNQYGRKSLQIMPLKPKNFLGAKKENQVPQKNERKSLFVNLFKGFGLDVKKNKDGDSEAGEQDEKSNKDQLLKFLAEGIKLGNRKLELVKQKEDEEALKIEKKKMANKLLKYLAEGVTLVTKEGQEKDVKSVVTEEVIDKSQLFENYEDSAKNFQVKRTNVITTGLSKILIFNLNSRGDDKNKFIV